MPGGTLPFTDWPRRRLTQSSTASSITFDTVIALAASEGGASKVDAVRAAAAAPSLAVHLQAQFSSAIAADATITEPAGLGLVVTLVPAVVAPKDAPKDTRGGSKRGSSGGSAAATAGGVIGGVVVLAALAFACSRRGNPPSRQHDEPQVPANGVVSGATVNLALHVPSTAV